MNILRVYSMVYPYQQHSNAALVEFAWKQYAELKKEEVARSFNGRSPQANKTHTYVHERERNGTPMRPMKDDKEDGEISSEGESTNSDKASSPEESGEDTEEDRGDIPSNRQRSKTHKNRADINKIEDPWIGEWPAQENERRTVHDGNGYKKEKGYRERPHNRSRQEREAERQREQGRQREHEQERNENENENEKVNE